MPHHLIGVNPRPRIGPDQAIDALSGHEVGADQAGEGERAFDDVLGDLDADGILAGAEEMSDFEGLFDPAKEQLDGPSPLVAVGHFLGCGIKIVAQAGSTGKLPLLQRDELALGRQATNPMIGSVLDRQASKFCPRNPLQQVAENAILMRRGIDLRFMSRRRADV